jgi:5-methylcytosine-specific restriction enzyme A
MPFRRCAYPTCSALVREGTGAWCPPHAAAQAKTARRYEQQRVRDRFRQFYQTHAWQVLRKTVLAERPSCVDCGGRATDLDHLVPVREAPERALDISNVAPRCHRHHSARTSRLHSWNRWKGER